MVINVIENNGGDPGDENKMGDQRLECFDPQHGGVLLTFAG